MALIEITDNIKSLFDEKNYWLQKGFDTVDHEICLKIYYIIVVIGDMQLCSADDTWQIDANLQLLTEYNLIQLLWNIEYPQGSVLGTLFFLSYITIHTELSGLMLLYAYDTTVFSSGWNLNAVTIKAQ